MRAYCYASGEIGFGRRVPDEAIHFASGPKEKLEVAVTYDQWKTTDPADNAPVCERCGGYMTSGFWRDECGECADEFLAEEAMLDFYQWEPT